MWKKNELLETPEREICYIQSKENGETETSHLLTQAQESRGCKMCSGNIMNFCITNYCHREMFSYMNSDIENWMDFFVCVLHLQKMRKAVYKCVQVCCLRSQFFLSSVLFSHPLLSQIARVSAYQPEKSSSLIYLPLVRSFPSVRLCCFCEAMLYPDMLESLPTCALKRNSTFSHQHLITTVSQFSQ